MERTSATIIFVGALASKLEARAKAIGAPKAQIIRQALAQYLEVA